MTDYNLLTVTELGQYAPEVDTSRFDSPTLSGIISQASKGVADYLEFTPYAETITNEIARGLITTEGDLIIFPQKVPIQTVTAIAITKGTVTVTLNLQTAGVNRYNIDYAKRHVRYPYNEISIQGEIVFNNFLELRGTHFYTQISYRGGWEVSELPATVKQAAVLFVKDILSSQYNQMGASSLRQGAVSFTFGDSQTAESKFLKDARRLLNPYRRIK